MSVTRAPKCAKMRKYRPTEELGSSAGFFQLYDSVLMKELGSGNYSGSTTKHGKRKSTKQKSKEILLEAVAELARLENLPSLKWTWVHPSQRKMSYH